jgi:hypothetical protein
VASGVVHKGKDEKVADLNLKAAAIMAAIRPSIGPYLAIPPNFLSTHVNTLNPKQNNCLLRAWSLPCLCTTTQYISRIPTHPNF